MIRQASSRSNSQLSEKISSRNEKSSKQSNGKHKNDVVSSGFVLLKFSRYGSPKEKIFNLSGDNVILSWKSKLMSIKMGKVNSLNLQNVILIEKGQEAPEFQRYKNIYGLAESKSLTIFYYDIPNDIALNAITSMSTRSSLPTVSEVAEVNTPSTSALPNYQKKSLNLICPSVEIYEEFLKAVTESIETLNNEKNEKSFDKRFVTSLWRHADIDHSGSLSWTEISERLLPRLNIKLTFEIIKIVEKVDRNNNGVLSYQEFLMFIKFVENRPDLATFWYKYLRNEGIPFIVRGPMNILTDAHLSDSEEASTMISLSSFIKFWYVLVVIVSLLTHVMCV